jgi:hypothetical protein
MNLDQLQELPAHIYDVVTSRSEFRTLGLILFSGFIGAASCMAMQTLISLDEVELREKKARELLEEKEKEKLVRV